MEDDSGPPEEEALPSLSDALRMAHGKAKRKPKPQKAATAATEGDKDSDDDGLYLFHNDAVYREMFCSAVRVY